MDGSIGSQCRWNSRYWLEAVDSFASIRGLYWLIQYEPRFVFHNKRQSRGQTLTSSISSRLSAQKILNESNRYRPYLREKTSTTGALRKELKLYGLWYPLTWASFVSALCEACQKKSVTTSPLLSRRLAQVFGPVPPAFRRTEPPRDDPQNGPIFASWPLQRHHNQKARYLSIQKKCQLRKPLENKGL